LGGSQRDENTDEHQGRRAYHGWFLPKAAGMKWDFTPQMLLGLEGNYQTKPPDSCGLPRNFVDLVLGSTTEGGRPARLPSAQCCCSTPRIARRHGPDGDRFS